jgi:hypothetical protein
LQKSTQVIDEILADAENMDGVEDQSGELETIKLSEFKVENNLAFGQNEIKEQNARKSSKALLRREAVEQHQDDNNNNDSRMP